MKKKMFYVAPAIAIHPMKEEPTLLASTGFSGGAGNSDSGGGWEDAKETDFEEDDDDNSFDFYQEGLQEKSRYYAWENKFRD